MTTTTRSLAILLASSFLSVAVASSATGQLAGTTIRIAVGAPLSGGAATFGVEMKQAVELALEEQNAAGGLLGARVEPRIADDEASDARGQAVARGFCEDSTVLAVVGHVNSNVSITASNVYQSCGL
jgi:branched-chain amino acid transport system substrate-binding protein